MNEAATIENERLMRLKRARIERLKKLAKAKKPAQKAKVLLSFREKIFKYKGLLTAALILDFTLGLIPIVCVVVNALFAAYLFFRFGKKKFLKVGLTAGLASVLDIIVGVLPVNFGAALVRVLLSEK